MQNVSVDTLKAVASRGHELGLKASFSDNDTNLRLHSDPETELGFLSLSANCDYIGVYLKDGPRFSPDDLEGLWAFVQLFFSGLRK